ncbi:MAG TPA: helix-turn-helix transcriptional regulator [Vicinamibacterales bacterium]|nr:helix-turn-helix transcriptional regulator [Vicinamibacterales bacterium]
MPDPARALRLRVGRAIQRLRLARGYSQETLAERAHSSGKYIGAIERGETNAGLDVLGRIAAALAVDPADLLVPPRGRGRIEAAHLIARADLDTLVEIVQRVKAVRARRTPRAAR